MTKPAAGTNNFLTVQNITSVAVPAAAAFIATTVCGGLGTGLVLSGTSFLYFVGRVSYLSSLARLTGVADGQATPQEAAFYDQAARRMTWFDKSATTAFILGLSLMVSGMVKNMPATGYPPSLMSDGNPTTQGQTTSPTRPSSTGPLAVPTPATPE